MAFLERLILARILQMTKMKNKYFNLNTGKIRLSTFERFELGYIPVTESGCWIWLTDCKSGYGRLMVDGRGMRAHRYSYLIHKGKIPKGIIVRHQCDMPACVNPDHLVLGTAQDNANDMVKRNRSLTGEKHHKSILVESQVIEIINSKNTTASLARFYGVGESTVRHIRQNTTWKHISRLTSELGK